MAWAWRPESFYGPSACKGSLSPEAGDGDDAVEVSLAFEDDGAESIPPATGAPAAAIEVAGRSATLQVVDARDGGHVGIETLSVAPSKSTVFRLTVRTAARVTIVFERIFSIETDEVVAFEDEPFPDATGGAVEEYEPRPAPVDAPDPADATPVPLPPAWQRTLDALIAGESQRLAEAPIVRAAEWLLRREDMRLAERDARQRARVEIRLEDAEPIVAELDSTTSGCITLPVEPRGRLAIDLHITTLRERAYVRGIESTWEDDAGRRANLKLPAYGDSDRFARVEADANGRCSLDEPLENALAKHLWIDGGCSCDLILRWGRPVEGWLDAHRDEPAPLPVDPDADALAAACAVDMARCYDLDHHVFRAGGKQVYGRIHFPEVGWLLSLLDLSASDDLTPEAVSLWRALAGDRARALSVPDTKTTTMIHDHGKPVPEGRWALADAWPLVETLARGDAAEASNAFAGSVRRLAELTRAAPSPVAYNMGKAQSSWAWMAERRGARSQAIAAAVLLRAGELLADIDAGEAGAELLDHAMTDDTATHPECDEHLTHHLTRACAIAIDRGFERFGAAHRDLLASLWRDARETPRPDPLRRLATLAAMRPGFLWYF